MDLFKTRQEVLKWLDAHQIRYDLYEHERTHTIDDCLKMPFITANVTICKNIMLCNRQQTRYFLLLLRPLTPFRTSVVSKALEVSRLSFAPETALEEMLHLTSGSVSPFGLLFDQQHKVTLCYEDAVQQTSRIAFHPCDNTATILLDQQIFWQQVIPAMGLQPLAISLNTGFDENN